MGACVAATEPVTPEIIKAQGIFLTSPPIGMFELRWISSENYSPNVEPL